MFLHSYRNLPGVLKKKSPKEGISQYLQACFHLVVTVEKRGFGAVVVSHSLFTSKVLSSIPSKVHLNVDSNPVLMWKEYSQRSAESLGFSPGTPVFSHRESWLGD